jgi:hypothetical protein
MAVEKHGRVKIGQMTLYSSFNDYFTVMVTEKWSE